MKSIAWLNLEKLRGYFKTGELRVRAAATIAANAATIIKEAVAKSLLYSDITRPGGKSGSFLCNNKWLRRLKWDLECGSFLGKITVWKSLIVKEFILK